MERHTHLFIAIRGNSRICSQCGVEYLYDDAATEMIPYAVEYLAGHLTDEEIALTAGYKAGKELREAEAAIFG